MTDTYLEENWYASLKDKSIAISDQNLSEIKTQLSDINAYYQNKIPREHLLPPEIDMWNYQKDHNHMSDDFDVPKCTAIGRRGIEALMSDLTPAVISDITHDITSVIPAFLVDDLVIRHRIKKSVASQAPDITYYYLKYDKTAGLFYCSSYEKRSYDKAVQKTNFSAVLSNPLEQMKTTERVNDIELICSLVIPVETIYASLIIGVHNEWKRQDFTDYPVFLTWHEDKPYKPVDQQLVGGMDDDAIAVLMEVFEFGIGMHRYLISLAEQREKIVVESDVNANRALPKPKTPQEKKAYRQNHRSIVSLSDSIKIYTKNMESTRHIRKPQKCQYRFSVRTHIRHYKNGKTVLIKSYDKNKNMPYKGHLYLGT